MSAEFVFHLHGGESMTSERHDNANGHGWLTIEIDGIEITIFAQPHQLDALLDQIAALRTVKS